MTTGPAAWLTTPEDAWPLSPVSRPSLSLPLSSPGNLDISLIYFGVIVHDVVHILSPFFGCFDISYLGYWMLFKCSCHPFNWLIVFTRIWCSIIWDSMVWVIHIVFSMLKSTLAWKKYTTAGTYMSYGMSIFMISKEIYIFFYFRWIK